MNRIMIITLLSVSLLAGSALAGPGDVKPDVLVKQRQAAMTLIGKYFGPLEYMTKGKIPYDAKIVATNVAYLDALAKMPWDGFQGSTASIKSETLPAVYKDPAKFKKAAHDMQQNLTKMKDAKGAKPDEMKQWIEEQSKVCKFCHDKFREKQEEADY